MTSTITTFPHLFKTICDKVYIWTIEISVEQGKTYIVTNHGYNNGKKVVHSKEVLEGKCGRSILEQTTQEASRKWTNKKEKELFEEWDKFMDKSNPLVECIIPNIQVRPMLAQTANLKKQDGRGYTIPFPAMVQRKYDGIRCIAYRGKNGQIILESRKGTPFSEFPSLTAELEHIFSIIPDTIYLDGELFTDQIDFETISGLVRSSTKTEKSAKLEKSTKKLTEKQTAALKLAENNKIKKDLIDFHIYDVIDTANLTQTFSKRWERLGTMIDWNIATKCKLVETQTVQTVDQVKPLHDQFVEEGFEGIILRDMDGVYQVNKRSKYLQKYKEFMDEEFEIVDFHEGVGNEKGAIVWDCVTASNIVFGVRPRGTFEERKEMFNNAASYIGQQLTVIFQEFTAEGVPRFPVGKGIRVNGM